MRHFARVAPIAILLVFAAASASAQEITPANLPADTSLVVFSHSSAQIRTLAPANPLVKTWYGPESAQVRKLLVQYVESQMDPKSNGQRYHLTQENTDGLLSVLENSLVFGVSGTPDYVALAQAPTSRPGNVLNKESLFFILDLTGKEAQFEKLWPALVAALPKEIAQSRYDFGGIAVEKFAGPNSTTFAARSGNRFVWSNQQKMIEDLIGRLKSGAPSGNTLAENADFQHCQAHSLPGTVFDVFFRLPDLSKIPIPATPQFDIGAAVKSLHLESMHAFCGKLSMTPEGELGRWLILGDTSQGSLLSWFGTNRTQFETLALVPPNAHSITVGTFDLQAFYGSFKNALGAGMPGRQQASADLMEGMLSMQLGMPLTDLLGVFRGEFAVVKFDSQSPVPVQVFALTVSNPQRILDLIHKLSPRSISEETQENGVTFFKTAAQIPTGGASQSPATDNYVALTPQLLLASTDKQVLRDFVARAGSGQSGASGASLADNPEVRRIRAMFPAEVLGFSITDYTHTDWQKELADAFTESGQEDKSKITPEELQLREGLKRIPWATAFGAFHWSVSAWWKDTDGIHFESRVQ